MDLDTFRSEVDRWVEEEIITDDQAAQILERYDEPRAKPPRSRAILALSLVGTALVFAGVTWFLATNWGGLSRLTRVAVLIAGPGAAYVAGAIAYRRAPRVGHALCVLGAVLVGPSVYLFDELYALGLADGWLLLVWAAVALPTGHALDSRPGTGVGLLVLITLVGELADPADPVAAIGLFGVVLFAIGHPRGRTALSRARSPTPAEISPGDRSGRVGWTYRVGGAAVTLAALLALTTLEGGFVQFDMEPSLIGQAVLLGALAGVGWLFGGGWRPGGSWAVVALLALAGSVAAAVYAPETVPDMAAFAVTHLVALVVLIATGYLGYLSESRGFVDLAALGALLQTLSFVAATVVDSLSGSAALVVAGLILLVVGVALEGGRRSVRSRVRPATSA